MASYLPQSDGLLPYWLLLVSVLALGNTVQSYTTLHFTTQVYCGPASSSPAGSKGPGSKAVSEVTALQSRTFGTWTFLSAIIRMYAAYNISNPAVYQMALWSYAIAWGHFMSEWLLFGTARWGRGLAGPVAVANFSLGWMLVCYGDYVR